VVKLDRAEFESLVSRIAGVFRELALEKDKVRKTGLHYTWLSMLNRARETHEDLSFKRVGKSLLAFASDGEKIYIAKVDSKGNIEKKALRI